MKDSKKQKGIKVKLTKCKRVSLRCPLTIDHTDLEYNYDAGCAQICLTVEKMGGGGLTDDTVESAIIVIRLFDAQGTLIPCTKNEYFAKLLRFGEEGLASGAHITFRLTPDCESGLRVENLELYISRIRFTDGTVTDYLRGDFFDLPGDAVPLQKKHKKEMETISSRFGSTALYEPEELTEIIWRCTCGEFCESDHCTTCGASKSELFSFFAPKAAASAVSAAAAANTVQLAKTVGDADALPNADSVSGTDPAVSADSGVDIGSPATEATTEYHTGVFSAGASAAYGSEAVESISESTSENKDSEDKAIDEPTEKIPPAAVAKKPDKLKIGLISAIAASALLLIVIVTLLIITLVARSNTPAQTTGPVETESPTTTQVPQGNESEKIVRTYLEQNDFDNALGFARMSECGDELINEVLNAALQYYTVTNPNLSKALKYAEELNDSEQIASLYLQLYTEALEKGDYAGAIQYADKLSESDRSVKKAEAAEGLVQNQLKANDFDMAIQTATTYQTATTPDQITRTAIAYYTAKYDFDKAIAMAKGINDQALIASSAEAAVTYYISQQNYDRAADYVGMSGNEDAINVLLAQFTKPSIKKHLPTFFSYLSFADKQAIHASVMDSDKFVSVIDVYGNAFFDGDKAYYAAGINKAVVSVKCSKLTTVILLNDGTVLAFGDNSYGQCEVSDWKDIVAIDASDYHTVGLKSDGSVVAAGRSSEKQCDVGQFSHVVAIAAGGYHTLVLLEDGTVCATGMSTSGQCNTTGWEDIVMISAGFLHSVGLKADGTVVAAGSSNTGRCDVDEWQNVIQISAGESCTVGLTSDGTVLLASGDQTNGDVSGMTNVIWVSAGSQSVTALLSDGTLVTTGNTPPDLTYPSSFEISTAIYGVH